ncbi:MAG TPA: amylo-alpha-1,6-glucosidase [Candidatus Sulfotelmatobacter sp.]|nr:amylo-alpha-1,6-glucosidase [Candidatus Sulfotelmatobacter sp.]
MADDRTRVLKSGDTFLVANRFGDIEDLGASKFGLFHAECRHLSRFTVRLNGLQPLLLSSTVREDNAFLSVDVSNADSPEVGSTRGPLPRGTIHIFRSQFLAQACRYEHIRLRNYGLEPIRVALSCQFDADFADIFEVRGTKRKQKGQRLPDYVEGNAVVLEYRGLDRIARRTRVEFRPEPASLAEHEATYRISLDPNAETSVFCSVSCERGDFEPSFVSYETALSNTQQTRSEHHDGECQVTSSSETFDLWLKRSVADLRMLTDGNPEGLYPYAGVPWFSTVFGRDGIITALECLWCQPGIAESVLRYLARTQASEIIPEQDAEPGKILHEMRRGEMAATKEVPFGRYYGSVDSTPLFVLLAAEYYQRTADAHLINEIWPNIKRALNWIGTFGDCDGDGFVEYQRMSDKGLTQQGWKDSQDSVFYADGRLAEAPIALCEVQAYVYAAKRGAASLARLLHDTNLAYELDASADKLQVQFSKGFWCEEIGSYALALDGNKEQCRVRASNAGHALFCRIADRDHAASVADTLLNEQSFGGWGVRTIAAGEPRYNPMSYHNGSVWPHDNAIISLGLSYYGFRDKVAQIGDGLHAASSTVELYRLPELFCGFHRRLEAGGPTLYPVACSPQAWAAGSIYMLLQAYFGLSINAPAGLVSFVRPQLPSDVDEIRVHNLRVTDARIDFAVRRLGSRVVVETLSKSGKLEVLETGAD